MLIHWEELKDIFSGEEEERWRERIGEGDYWFSEIGN